MRKRNRKRISGKDGAYCGSELVARFGNFLVKRIGDGRNMWLRITTADGGWGMDFRDDSLKYGWMAQCLASESEGVRRAFESWIVLTYHMAQVWPDPDFLEDVVNSLERLQERVSLSALEREGKEAHENAETVV